MTPQTCATCRWHDRSDFRDLPPSQMGLCRRHPPQVIWEPDAAATAFFWPETHQGQ